jgi:hypothetical protein
LHANPRFCRRLAPRTLRYSYINAVLSNRQGLQFHGEGYRDAQTFETWGIVYVPDPYTAR